MNENNKILVVDDETHILHVVKLKLSNAGYNVLVAHDGEEGYEVACENNPDLIITDLQMPYVTGLEMCRKLIENPATSNIPVLLLTARGYSLSDEDLSSYKIIESMSKPFSPRELLAKVEDALMHSMGG